METSTAPEVDEVRLRWAVSLPALMSSCLSFEVSSFAVAGCAPLCPAVL